MTSGPTPAVRKLCYDRDKGACVSCKRYLTDSRELQHRKARGMGGSLLPWINQPANLIWLCPQCHHWMEVEERREAVLRGYVIQGTTTAEEAPIYYQGRWARLTNDGQLHYLHRTL